MATFHGYILVQLEKAFTHGFDQDRETHIKRAFRGLSSYKGNLPHWQLQYRFNLAKTAMIVEALWDAPPNKGGVVRQLANTLGLNEATLTNNVDFQIFAGDWATSRDAALAYLEANRAAWERPMPILSGKEV